MTKDASARGYHGDVYRMALEHSPSQLDESLQDRMMILITGSKTAKVIKSMSV